jgi:GNAT superfamily N-acetyltransferase
MPADALKQIVDFTRRTTELTADEVRQVPGAWIFDTPSIDVAWGLNHVRLTARMSYSDAVALADEAQVRLPFRRVTAEPSALTPTLEGAFAAGGWKAQKDLLMVLRRRPRRHVDTSGIVEVDARHHLDLGRMWSLEEAPDTPEDVLDALCDFWQREAEVRRDRLLGAPDPDGPGILAKAKLRSDGRVAQVEDVYAVPSARGRGLGRALVTRAVEIAGDAGHDVIFIVADEDDWPRHLYEQVGFDPIGRIVHFHLQLPIRQQRLRVPHGGSFGTAAGGGYAAEQRGSS